MSASTFGRAAMNSRMVGSLIAAQSQRSCLRKAMSASTFAHHSRSMPTAATCTHTAGALSSAWQARAWQTRAWQARAGQAGACQCQARRALSTSTVADDVMYLPMPKLSPNMTRGKVTKWLKAEGDEINEYDAILELSTDSLYAPGDAPVEGASVDMIIELAEYGYVGKFLVAEGETVEVGQAVMSMCEEEETVDILKKAPSPGVDFYSDHGTGLRIATYQGYLNGKTAKEEDIVA